MKTEMRHHPLLTGALLMLVVVMAFSVSFSLQTECAYALGVPKVIVDESNISSESAENVMVTGTVSQSKGQDVVLLADDEETVLSQVKIGSGGGKATFQLRVPTMYLTSGKGKVYVQSLSAPGVTASKRIPVTVTIKDPKKSQTITAASSVTLTNLKTTAKLGAKASSGLKVTYKSSNSQVVSVKSNGEIKRKKNGKATITITQAGNGSYLPATKTVSVTCRKSTCQEQINGAVGWAVMIANDNSFSYGTGSGAHHNGCYFCGTNYGPRKYMKPSKKYKKTYCCNPFVHAAYAHGAKNPKMLKGCQKASGIGMEKSTFFKFDCWKSVGKPAYKNLKKGDVLVKSTHVAMYIGKGKMVEASGGNWSASSIAVKKMSKSRYNGFTYVMRYTGY